MITALVVVLCVLFIIWLVVLGHRLESSPVYDDEYEYEKRWVVEEVKDE